MEALAQGWFGGTVAALAGLCVGSFANVAIYRLPIDGLSVMRPARSFCPACGTKLSWMDNVPVVAWLLLHGRCRSCQSAISWRYPAIELLTAALFVLFWWLLPPGEPGALGQLLVAWVTVATCVVVSAIDLEHFIIPDAITMPGTVLGLVLSAAWPALHAQHVLYRPESPHGSSLIVAVAGALAGGGSLWLVGRLGNLMLRKQVEAAGVEDAMGLGDVKWMALAGTILGPLLVLEAILTACFFGAIIGILLKLWARLSGSSGPVGLPFGPFLSMGILLELAAPGIAWDLLQP